MHFERLVCLVYLVDLVFWLNESNQINQINQINPGVALFPPFSLVSLMNGQSS
jgi:hypothetical protein